MDKYDLDQDVLRVISLHLTLQHNYQSLHVYLVFVF